MLVGGVCVCRSGLGIVEGQCVGCPANSYIAPNGNCQCNEGLKLNASSLVCVSPCYPNASPNALGQCICASGYYNTGSSCVKAECVNGQVWNGGACVCPQGMVVDSITNQCSYCNTPDRMVSSGACLCSPSYYPTSLGCSPCPPNALFNATAKNCSCLPNYRMETGQCVLAVECPLESVWTQATLKCECNYFQNYVINGYCQPCPLNSRWNGSSCSCDPGFVFTGTLCVCPTGQIWNGFTCVCPANKYLIGTVCGFCDPHASYDGHLKKCICRAGWFAVYDRCSQCDPSCATCSNTATRCLSCPAGYSLANAACRSKACTSKQFLDANKVCQDCMANCAVCDSGTTCTTCSSGYSPTLVVSAGSVVSSCQLPPSGTSSTLSLRGQVVGKGVVMQGVTLTLMPTSILANNCDICSSLLAVQVTSSFATISATAEFVANSQYWFVVTFTLASAPFFPNFQFSLQINPQYAAYFSPADMAQKVTATYSQADSSPAIPNPNLTTTTRYTASDPTAPKSNLDQAATPASPAASGSKTPLSPSGASDPQTLALLFK
jgi:hypothetical protein